ncbi:hypothetical protein F4779DRAFT_451162 [Xylariaceae sp. FL0662B]|nr:hypothetical protein F4779DRAFT_451162 [Xylariaceae sp. FL0662B]
MQFLSAALCLLSATSALAAPSSIYRRQFVPAQNTTFFGFAVPNVLKIYNANTGQAVFAQQTQAIRSNTVVAKSEQSQKEGVAITDVALPLPKSTVPQRRQAATDTSTYYQFSLPASASGRTCRLVIHASLNRGYNIQGTQAIDIFTIQSADLGNQMGAATRLQYVARLRFNQFTSFYYFDYTAVYPTVQFFACPLAGQNLTLEAAPVGDYDINIIPQDFTAGTGFFVPNGVSIGYF